MFEEIFLASGSGETLQPDLPAWYVHERVEVIVHDAVGDQPHAGEIRQPPQQTLEASFG